jgi:hypothetical protein
MRRRVVIATIGGLALTCSVAGIVGRSMAESTVLDGFAINTQDKAVTVTLYTDKRAQYTTESQGRQFTITLPDTQVSQKQIENGLPVVIDNRNRFIGQAVPTGDGRVKIVLPNLPSNEYAVSIQQQPHHQSSTGTVTMEVIKPRSAMKSIPESRFEQVASSFVKPAAKPMALAGVEPSTPTAMQATHVDVEDDMPMSTQASRGTIWNPYVVKRSSSIYRAVPRRVTRRAEVATDSDAETGAPSRLALTPHASSLPMRLALETAEPVSTMKDPLWYLHSLPSANSAQMPQDNLQGPAQQPPTLSQVVAAASGNKPAGEAVKVPEKAKTAVQKSRMTMLKQTVQSLPSWLWLALALFMGGIGLFGLVGAVVLLRLLFTQTRPMSYGSSIPQPALGYAMPPVMYSAGMPLHGAVAMGMPIYPGMEVSEASDLSDTVSVNAMDYLKTSPENLSEAVQSATLIKFPARHAGRFGRAKRPLSGVSG